MAINVEYVKSYLSDFDQILIPSIGQGVLTNDKLGAGVCMIPPIIFFGTLCAQFTIIRSLFQQIRSDLAGVVSEQYALLGF